MPLFLFFVSLEKGMGQNLFQCQSVIIVNDKDALDYIFELRAYLLPLGKGILTSLHLFQCLPHRPSLKRADPELEAKENDAHSPHISRKRIPEPTDRLRCDIVGRAAGLSLELVGVR